jgi:hypothetical protein
LPTAGANRWSELADTLPIWSCVAVTIITVAAKLRARPPHPAPGSAVALGAVATLVFLVTGEGAPPAATPALPGLAAPPDPFNGSLQYAPAVLAMAVFAALMFRRRHPQR